MYERDNVLHRNLLKIFSDIQRHLLEKRCKLPWVHESIDSTETEKQFISKMDCQVNFYFGRLGIFISYLLCAKWRHLT